MGNLAILITSITAFIAIFFQPSLISLIQKWKLNKLISISEAKDLLNDLSTDFKERFVKSSLEEEFFYIRTGIKTNYKSISKYMDLKDKLGADYDWKQIRIAKNHFIIGEEKITINITKPHNFNYYLDIFVALFFFFGGLSLFFYLIYLFGDSLNVVIVACIILFVSYIASYFFLISPTSTLTAKRMQKRLLEVENGN
jgi:magnesium-transporting ATPase (P-type)